MNSTFHVEQDDVVFGPCDPRNFRRITKWWGWYNDPFSINPHININPHIYHNENGPAVCVYKNDVLAYEAYVVSGLRHRIDGPAIICTDTTVLGFMRNSPYEEYWILNKQISKEEFETPGFVDAFIIEHS